MSGIDAVLGLWLALNTTTLLLTLADVRVDLRSLHAVMRDLAAAPDRRPLLVTALRDVAQDAFILATAASFDLAGIAQEVMVHGHRRGDPLLTVVYVLAFLIAAGLLALKQGQKRIAGWLVRRLHDAHPWDK